MKLYTDYKPPNPRRLNYFLAYKGIDIDTQIISLNDNENLTEEFEKINPLRTVPTLVVDEERTLTDTIAICLYLEKKYPEKPLFGTDDFQMAEVIGWCHRVYFYGFDPVAEILRNHSPFFKGRVYPLKTKIEQNPDLVERGKLRLHDFWIEMEAHLKDKDFIASCGFSQADIDAWLIPSFAKWVGLTIPEEFEAVHRWYSRVTELLPKLG